MENGRVWMRIRRLVIICIFSLFILEWTSPFADAVANQQSTSISVLVIGPFDGEAGKVEQRRLDLLISHFTSQITFKHTDEVNASDLKHVTHVVYFGYQSEQIPRHFSAMLSDFSGTVLAIGKNVEQFGDRFHFVQPIGTKKINQLYVANRETEASRIETQNIIELAATDENESWLIGKDTDNQIYPLLIQEQSSFYLAVTTVASPIATFVAEGLHEVFQSNHEPGYQGYIRLEDVHPLVEAEKLMAIAEQLKERQIPYMVAVIPVYIHPETKERHYLSDSPALLDTLKFIQKNGGSIVLHGYTHQFRDSETGEGFEFWDVEHNMPIYHQANEQPQKKIATDFSSAASYQTFLTAQQKIEKAYIEDKLTKGIETLANDGLYPLAFEAPHYAMSQHGYQITSSFFSTYVGQIQLSDVDWQIMTEAPYVTQPSFLNGMTLWPETIGYVENGSFAMEKMELAIERQMHLRDAMIAGFYHPYLGLEGFEDMLAALEKIPNITWIDLKQWNNTTETENVTIQSSHGKINTEINYVELFQKDSTYLFRHVRKARQDLLWIFVGMGGLAVCLFIVYLITIKGIRQQSYKSYRRR